jgi:hemolysin type calcium-binding protein
MRRVSAVAFALPATLCLVAAAGGAPAADCSDCAGHEYWPRVDGVLKKAHGGGITYHGTSRSDELLGGHGSDTLRGGGASDILWGDSHPSDQPASQTDVIDGGDGTDFIYGSHGTNTIDAGAGNDVISVHFGRGRVDCGPGRDIYHVARSRRARYTFRHCEKADYRPEAVRGPMKPLH